MTKTIHSFFTLFQFVGLTTLNSVLREVHQSDCHADENVECHSFMSKTIDPFHHLNSHFDKTLNVFSIFAFASSSADNGTYTLREMLKQSDVSKFVEAMIKEVDDHVNRMH